MKPVFGMVLALACLWQRAAALRAGPGRQQCPRLKPEPAAIRRTRQRQQPSRTQQQTNSNPFPEDTNSVPVMPTRNSPGAIPGLEIDAASGRIPMPAADADPVRSPEDAAAAEQANETELQFEPGGTGNLLPPPDDDTQRAKRNRKGQEIVPSTMKSAAEDENVGNYYLDNKDWKGALSRFQSALVLDPDNPDVYWGLAESQRHLGDFADARANYLKVMEYDPDSHHAKEARKALEDPEIANAKATVPAAPPAQ